MPDSICPLSTWAPWVDNGRAMSLSSSAKGRLIDEVARLCARAQDPLVLFEQVAERVREHVPYEGAGWILVDPDTLLINGVYAEDVDRDLHLQLIACELTEDDVNKFWDLAERGVAAVALSDTTDGDLSRSTRWARLYGPNGYGDELRMVFATGRDAWGHGCLTRCAGDPFFTRAETDLIAVIAPHVGNGIRSSYLLGDLAGGEAPAPPAVVMLADDGSVTSVTPQSEAWLGSPVDSSLESTVVLHEVAARARAIADGVTHGPPPLARARARSGEWVVVRGVRMPDDLTALVLEPARRSDLAPLLLRLHQLTDRERQVTQLLLRGMSTADIASELWITSETLRGHVKSVFAKLGISSRPELAALLSHEPRVRVRSSEPVGRRNR